MNFNAVQQAQGQLTPMFGTLLEIGASKLNKNNKPYCSCKIADTTGTSHNVTINAGKDGLPPANMLGMLCRWALQSYQGQYGIAFGGFYNGTGQQGQTVYRPPQAPSQAPPQPPQGPIAPPARQDDVQVYIIRQTAIKAATEMFCAGKIEMDNFFAICNDLVQYTQTGQVLSAQTVSPPAVEGPPLPTEEDYTPDDGIPF